jgi:aryl-alcohol dehydrogenase-like predicted oxidoreductase
MQTRQLGASAVTVSALGVGGNTFGPPRLDAAQTGAVVGAALDMGVNFVDTAPSYGRGQSEEYLGAALGRRRSEMVIATKYVISRDSDESVRAQLNQQLEESLRRLGTDYVDLYQQHWPSPAVPAGDLLAALDDLVKEGKVRAIGVCNYAAWRLAESACYAATHHTAAFLSVQNYYHLLARQVEGELLPYCRLHGLSLIPYNPLAGGFLTGKYRPSQADPAGSRGSAGSRAVAVMKREEHWRKLDRLSACAVALGHSVGELAIAWLLRDPVIGPVITGREQPRPTGTERCRRRLGP